MNEQTKTCTRCGEVKPLTVFRIRKSNGRPDSWCNPCKAADLRERYHADPETARERQKQFKARNPEKIKEKRRRHYEKNNVKEYQREYYRQNIEAKRAYHREYARKRRASLTPEQREQVRLKHREAGRLYTWKRRAEEKAASRAQRQERRRQDGAKEKTFQDTRRRQKIETRIEEFSKQEIIDLHGPACYLCGRVLTFDEVTIDHVQPLSRGGLHIRENARPACQKCNSRKGSKTLAEYRRYLEQTAAKSEAHAALLASLAARLRSGELELNPS